MTTPPAVELSRIFASMADAGCRAGCMEVSSHALDQRRADALRFAVAIFTNLTGDHLDYHKTLENYLAAKRRLFDLLPPDGVRVLNADDPASDAMDGPNTRWCTTRSDPRASWRVEARDAGIDGMTLRITCPLGRDRGEGDGGGGPQRDECAAVRRGRGCGARAGRAGCAKARRDAIEKALPLIQPPTGRLQKVSGRDDRVSVFVDYAHTDDALARTLGAVRDVLPAGSTLTAVFGCGGNKDTTKRPRMGRVASELSHKVVVTSDNPRSERPSAIVDQILAGIPAERRDAVTVQVDRGLAIRHAVMTAQDGEIIVIAGKGHETEQISCDAAGEPVVRHFDDAEEARAALRERRLRGTTPPPAARAGVGRA
jgi:UDP-N-acetylmuramyl tripeptide synthase